MNRHSVPVAATRRERDKQERRAAILAAAERVIVARGFAEASIDGIAREAGLAAGTVYLYFPNKEALIQELLGNKVRQLNDAVAAQTHPKRPFADALRAVVQAMFLHFEAHRGFFGIFVRERMELSRHPAQADGVMREIEAGAEHVTRWIGAAQRAGHLASGKPRLCAAALRGMVFQFTRDWLRSGCGGRLTRHTPFVTGFFLKGAGA